MGDPVRVGKVGMSGPLVRFADTRAACPYQKVAHSISYHVRISEGRRQFPEGVLLKSWERGSPVRRMWVACRTLPSTRKKERMMPTGARRWV